MLTRQYAIPVSQRGAGRPPDNSAAVGSFGPEPSWGIQVEGDAIQDEWSD